MSAGDATHIDFGLHAVWSQCSVCFVSEGRATHRIWDSTSLVLSCFLCKPTHKRWSLTSYIQICNVHYNSYVHINMYIHILHCIICIPFCHVTLCYAISHLVMSCHIAILYWSVLSYVILCSPMFYYDILHCAISYDMICYDMMWYDIIPYHSMVIITYHISSFDGIIWCCTL